MADITKEQARQASYAWEAFLRADGTLDSQIATDPIWSIISMHEYDVLYTLAKAGCALSQSELLGAVTLSQPSVSRLLHRMEGRGLVKRKASQDDARSYRVEMTQKGRALQREVGKKHGKQVAQALFTRLNGEEVALLQSLCTKMAADP